MLEKDLVQEIFRLNDKLNFYKLSRQCCFKKITVDDCHSSNSIEGNTLTKIETKILLERGYPDKLHNNEEHEIIDYDNARNVVLDWYLNKEQDLTIDKITTLHSVLIQDPIKSGYIRQLPGRDEVVISGRTDIKLTAAAQVYTELEDIIDIYNTNLQEGKDQSTMLEVIIDFKYDFVCVHPFLDGNGRTSRLLLNYLLMANGFRPICIDSIDNGKAYKDAIYETQKTGDLSYYRSYMYKEIIRNYKNYLQEIKTINGVVKW